jgi:hypothetical protein
MRKSRTLKQYWMLVGQAQERVIVVIKETDVGVCVVIELDVPVGFILGTYSTASMLSMALGTHSLHVIRQRRLWSSEMHLLETGENIVRGRVMRRKRSQLWKALVQSQRRQATALTNVGRHDTRVGRTSACTARAHKHMVRIEEAQARVTPQGKPAKEGAGEQETETQDHADEQVGGDARVHCGKEDDAGNGDERGKYEHVLEAAEQSAQVGELGGGGHC